MKLSNNYSIQEFKGNEQEKQKTKKVNGFIPQCTASIVASIPVFFAGEYSSSVVSKMRKLSNLPDDTVNLVHSVARDVVKKEGLDKFGVSIELLPKLKQKPSLKAMIRNPILQVNEGLNSLFLGQNLKTINEFEKEIAYKKNTVFLPEKKSCLTAFHELGHAANFNKSKLTKSLLVLNAYGQKLAFLPMIYGVLTRKSKPDEEGNLTKGQKVKNLVRDNAGKIAFACFVPSLIEEGLASLRAQGYAKKYLTADLVKKVTKTNVLAYTTYLAMAVVTAFATKLGVDVKDKMIADKESKALLKMNNENS